MKRRRIFLLSGYFLYISYIYILAWCLLLVLNKYLLVSFKSKNKAVFTLYYTYNIK